MDHKRIGAISDLLVYDLGMSTKAAAGVVWKWQKSDSKATVESYFIRTAILHQIDEYRAQNFTQFGVDISVYPARGAEVVHVDVPHVGKIAIGYNIYTFQPIHNEGPSKDLGLRLIRGAYTQVWLCQSWQPLSAYLAEVDTTRKFPFHSQTELDRQDYWWRTNGKTFDFKDLPGELRNQIYDIHLPSVVEPFPSHRSRNVRVVPRFDHPPTALFKTDKQVKDEASDRFYKTSPFLIQHCTIFRKTLNNRDLRDRLHHLRLDMTHDELLTLFCFTPMGTNTFKFVKHQFRKLNNLESLELHIKPPSKANEMSWLDGACQKTFVDILMKAAWPSLKGLPVIITGYVKHSQMKVLKAQFTTERESYLSFKALAHSNHRDGSLRAYDNFLADLKAEDDGGVRLDGSEAPDSTEDTTGAAWSNMSLDGLREAVHCSCKTPCSKHNWDPTA